MGDVHPQTALGNPQLRETWVRSVVFFFAEKAKGKEALKKRKNPFHPLVLVVQRCVNAHAEWVMVGVTFCGGTAPVQAGHSAGFCLKFRQGLGISFLSFLIHCLPCWDKCTPVVPEPDVLYANQMPTAGCCQVLLPLVVLCHDQSLLERLG